MNEFSVLFISIILWFIIKPGQCLLQANEETSNQKENELSSEPLYSLVFIFGGIFWGTLCKIILTKLNLPLSYSSLVLPMGIIVGVFAIHFEAPRRYLGLVFVAPKYILHIFIPVLAFRIAFCIDFHILLRSQLQIYIIGLPVLFLTASCTGLLMMLLIDPDWTIAHAFLFGLMCSPVYAAFVTNFLRKRATKTKHTEILLEGEAMLGMATITVPFSFLCEYLMDGEIIIAKVAVDFLKFTAIGIVLGLVVGVFGRIFLRKASDYSTIIIITLVISLLTNYVCFFDGPFASSGIIAVIIVAVMMSAERSSLPEELDSYVTKFWDFLYQIAHTLILLIASIAFTLNTVQDMEPKDFALIFITYVVSIVTRFLCFLLFAPILSRISYGMSFSQMIFLVWGGLKSSVNLVYVMHINGLFQEKEIVRVMFMHIFGLVVLNVYINYTLLPLIFRVIGWGAISLARETNMNNCVKHMKFTRERAIAFLKMDRFVTDANWPVVQSVTTIKHPYKLRAQKDGDENGDTRDEYLMGYRYGYCDDCKKEVLNEPTAKELKEMMKEARMRILEAQKISFGRQYENGMLTLQGMRILIQAIEMAMDSPKAILELDGLFKMFHRRGCLYYFGNYLLRYQKTEPPPPMKYWRRVCYDIATHKCFTIFINLIIVLSIIPILLEFFFMRSLFTAFGYTILAINTIIYLIFLGEFFIKIFAYSTNRFTDGLRHYFKSGWNILDFIILLLYTMDICYKYQALIRNVDIAMRESFLVIMRLLKLLVYVKLLSLWILFAPKIVIVLNTIIDKNLAFAYDVGKGFVSAQEQVLETLSYMIDHEKIKQELRAQLEEDRMAITKELGNVQRDRPWIAITVKTTQAMTTVLNHIKAAIDELRVSGWADDVECSKLTDSLAKSYKFVKSIKYIQPSSPNVIFQEVVWLEGDNKVTEFLYENVVTKKYEPGDFICKEGEIGDGIFVVVTGLLISKYLPKMETLNDMEEYGCLPIVDYVSSDKFDAAIDDYIVSGNTFGELCTLTGRVYSSTIMAETHCQVYMLSRENVKAAMSLSFDPVNGLECRLWKSVSIRLATSILMDVPAYQGATQDKIRSTLERSFIPNMSIYKSFTVNQMMKDIILIEGIILDDLTGKTYVAPKYIPRTVKKILLPDHDNFKTVTKTTTRLLIIPIKDVEEYDVMMEANENAELMSIDSGSTRFLLHSMRKRPSSSKKKAKYLRPLRQSPSMEKRASIQNNLPEFDSESRMSKVTILSSEIQRRYPDKY